MSFSKPTYRYGHTFNVPTNDEKNSNKKSTTTPRKTKKNSTRKRSENIHDKQMLESVLSHDHCGDIKGSELERLSKKATLKSLYVDPEKSEDFVPFTLLPYEEQKEMIEIINTDLVETMKKRNEYDEKFDIIKLKVPIDHYHADIFCPYPIYNEKTKNQKTINPTVIMNNIQIEYLEEMNNYKAFEKYIMPKMKNIQKKQTYRFHEIEKELKDISLKIMHIGRNENNLFFCIRFDYHKDLMFLCIIYTINNSIPEILLKQEKLSYSEISENIHGILNDLKLKLKNYFYFSCGCGCDNYNPDSNVDEEYGKLLDIFF